MSSFHTAIDRRSAHDPPWPRLADTTSSDGVPSVVEEDDAPSVGGTRAGSSASERGQVPQSGNKSFHITPHENNIKPTWRLTWVLLFLLTTYVSIVVISYFTSTCNHEDTRTEKWFPLCICFGALLSGLVWTWLKAGGIQGDGTTESFWPASHETSAAWFFLIILFALSLWSVNIFFVSPLLDRDKCDANNASRRSWAIDGLLLPLYPMSTIIAAICFGTPVLYALARLVHWPIHWVVVRFFSWLGLTSPPGPGAAQLRAASPAGQPASADAAAGAPAGAAEGAARGAAEVINEGEGGLVESLRARTRREVGLV